MSLRFVFVGLPALVALAFASGCERDPDSGDLPPSELKPGESPSRPAPPARPAAPWFAGTFSGAAPLLAGADVARINDPEPRDDETIQSGKIERKLTLSVLVSEPGVASGAGQFGPEEVSVRGVFDGKILRITLAGPRTQATLIAERGSDAAGKASFSGRVSASTTENEMGRERVRAYSGPIALIGSL